MSTSNVFSSRALVGLAVVCGVSLLVGLIVGALGTDLTGHRSAGPDSFSRSALGHKALVEFLRELQIPVSRHLDDPAAAATRGGVVIVAEPHFSGPGDIDVWDELYENFYNILIVLPKRTGVVDPVKPSWLARSWLLLPAEVQQTLDGLGIDASVVRTRNRRQQWSGTAMHLAPPNIEDLQLIASDSLQPLWSTEDGILAGYWAPDPEIQEKILVLADPDLLANHGLGRADNARHVLELIELLGGLTAGVVIDESVHGFGVSRSIWREFFRFPLSLVAIQLLLTGGALAWLSVRRFGRAVTLPAAHGSGQEYLIDNTAGLLEIGGHGVLILQGYLEAAVTAVTRELRLDGRLTPAQTRQRLLRIGRARGVTDDLDEIERRVRHVVAGGSARESQLLAAAGAIQRWRRQITQETTRERTHGL